MMLGDILIKLRTEKNLNQNTVASKLNISSVNYNRYEKNQRSPDNGTLVSIADFYNVTTDFLLGRTSIRKPSVFSNLSAIELEMLSIVSKLPADEQQKLIEYANFLISQRE